MKSHAKGAFNIINFTFHPVKRICMDVNYFLNLIAKFSQLHNLELLQNIQPRILVETAQIELLGHFGIKLNISICRITEAPEISFGCLYNIAIVHRIHLFKMKICQELIEDDFNKRVQSIFLRARRSLSETLFRTSPVFKSKAWWYNLWRENYFSLPPTNTDNK